MFFKKRQNISERSLVVSQTYLQRGWTTTRSLWVRVSPRNPLLKILLLPPLAVLGMTLLILMLILIGFTLLAIAVMSVIPKTEGRES